MKEHQSTSAYSNTNSCVITIGTFDGVHIGHKAILQRLVNTAHDEGLDAVLLTFFPHPRMVLQSEGDLKLINTLEERKKLIAETGVDHLVIEPFTKEFSRLTAQEYVEEILVDQLHARKIIIGYDHRFGRNRTANINDLIKFGDRYEFDVIEISAQELDEVAVSSTKIRNALQVGDISTANNYLGYNYTLSGKVVSGKGLGKTFGYPTANLKVAEAYKLIPKEGVYLVQSEISGSKKYGLTSIGTNPTVGGTTKTIETYFLDCDEDLYDQKLQLEFLTHIRDEEHFESVALLKVAIAKDIEFAHSYLNHE